jgi:hypothetical protein
MKIGKIFCYGFEIFFRFLGISSTLKVTTSIKMIEVFMLVSLMLCFCDVLMQCYLHYYGPHERSDKEEENNPPDMPLMKTTPGFSSRSSSAVGRGNSANVLTLSDYLNKMETEKGTKAGDVVLTNMDVEGNALPLPAATIDPDRPRKEAIFDLAMRPESAGPMDVPLVADCWDTKHNPAEEEAK